MLAAGPGPAADGDLYLVELAPFASYEVTVDAASGDLGDFGPIVEVLARDMTLIGGSAPSGVGHAQTVRMIGSSSASMPTLYRYIRVRSAGCTTDCGADDTYRIRLRETTGRVARFNQTGGQRTVMILQNTTGECDRDGGPLAPRGRDVRRGQPRLGRAAPDDGASPRRRRRRAPPARSS